LKGRQEAKESAASVSGIFNSDNTLACATSAKRPERKSELYEERETPSRSSSDRVERFRSVKRTPPEEAQGPPLDPDPRGGGGIEEEIVAAELAVVIADLDFEIVAQSCLAMIWILLSARWVNF
jgi:hypothetical protein